MEGLCVIRSPPPTEKKQVHQGKQAVEQVVTLLWAANRDLGTGAYASAFLEQRVSQTNPFRPVRMAASNVELSAKAG